MDTRLRKVPSVKVNFRLAKEDYETVKFVAANEFDNSLSDFFRQAVGEFLDKYTKENY